MYIEIVIVALIIFFVMFYTKRIDSNKFIMENEVYLKGLKEKDYDFYVRARYGDTVDVNVLFITRLKNSFYVMIIILLLFLNNLTFINFVAIMVVSYFVYKSQYIKLRNYYKKYMHEIDQMLPYYLKSLEILCQNYTVPVAISRSIDDAPDIFKPGLRDMIASIDAGDSSIEPYMRFAKEYPVRDSMRMMRLLYRLSLGAQENKYQMLTSFSKSVSSLQNKAREIKYRNRLANMEKRTMMMLIITGGGTLVILLLSTIMLFGV